MVTAVRRYGMTIGMKELPVLIVLGLTMCVYPHGVTWLLWALAVVVLINLWPR